MPVAGNEELLLHRIPDGKCPLSVEPPRAVFSLFLIEVQDYLGVRVGRKLVPFLDQLVSKFEIVEYFTVKRDPELPVRNRHRLASALEVNDAQTGMRQARSLGYVYTAVIGT